MRFDLSQPAQLSGALGPDLVLMGGAMLLLLWAGWRRESDAHQRNVGILSILVCIITMIVVDRWRPAKPRTRSRIPGDGALAGTSWTMLTPALRSAGRGCRTAGTPGR